MQCRWNNLGETEIPRRNEAWPKHTSRWVVKILNKQEHLNPPACFTLHGQFAVSFLLQYHYNKKRVSYSWILSEAGPINGRNSKIIKEQLKEANQWYIAYSQGKCQQSVLGRFDQKFKRKREAQLFCWREARYGLQ